MLFSLSRIFTQVSDSASTLKADLVFRYKSRMLMNDINNISLASVFTGGKQVAAESILKRIEMLPMDQLIPILKFEKVGVLACAGQAAKLFSIISSLSASNFSNLASQSNTLGWLIEAGQGQRILDFVETLDPRTKFCALSSPTTVTALIKNGYVDHALLIIDTFSERQKSEILSNRLISKSLAKIQHNAHTLSSM